MLFVVIGVSIDLNNCEYPETIMLTYYAVTKLMNETAIEVQFPAKLWKSK